MTDNPDDTGLTWVWTPQGPQHFSEKPIGEERQSRKRSIGNMSRDYGSHRRIRRSILGQMPEELNTYSSHEGTHDIALFLKKGGGEIYLAEPDIVTIKGRRILIIEVELSDQPKKIFGDACTAFLSTNGRYGEVGFDIDRRSLLVVLGHSDAAKKNKGKRKNNQLDEMIHLVKSLLAFESFEIVSEADAFDAVVRWAKSDQETHSET